MYINYPNRFAVKVSHIDEYVLLRTYEEKFVRKISLKNKEKQCIEEADNIYKIIDEEYAESQICII